MSGHGKDKDASNNPEPSSQPSRNPCTSKLKHRTRQIIKGKLEPIPPSTDNSPPGRSPSRPNNSLYSKKNKRYSIDNLSMSTMFFLVVVAECLDYSCYTTYQHWPYWVCYVVCCGGCCDCSCDGAIDNISDWNLGVKEKGESNINNSTGWNSIQNSNRCCIQCMNFIHIYRLVNIAEN